MAGGPSGRHLDCVGNNLVGRLYPSLPVAGSQRRIRRPRDDLWRDWKIDNAYQEAMLALILLKGNVPTPA